MKKVILIVVPLLLIGGGAGTFFAAKSGAIKIPGITPPAKKAANAAALYGPDKKDDALAKKETETEAERPERRPEPEPARPKDDPVAGLKTLATLWGEMAIDPLVATTSDWSPESLAPVLLMMEPEKVSKLLAQIATKDPKRASEISREVQKAASDPSTPKFESA